MQVVTYRFVRRALFSAASWMCLQFFLCSVKYSDLKPFQSHASEQQRTKVKPQTLSCASRLSADPLKSHPKSAFLQGNCEFGVEMAGRSSGVGLEIAIGTEATNMEKQR